MGILRTQLRAHDRQEGVKKASPRVPRTSALGVTKVQPGRWEGGGQGEGRGKKEQR